MENKIIINENTSTWFGRKWVYGKQIKMRDWKTKKKEECTHTFCMRMNTEHWKQNAFMKHIYEIMIGAHWCFHTALLHKLSLDKVLIGTKQQQNYEEKTEKKMENLRNDFYTCFSFALSFCVLILGSHMNLISLRINFPRGLWNWMAFSVCEWYLFVYIKHTHTHAHYGIVRFVG